MRYSHSIGDAINQGLFSIETSKTRSLLIILKCKRSPTLHHTPANAVFLDIMKKKNLSLISQCLRG